MGASGSSSTTHGFISGGSRGTGTSRFAVTRTDKFTFASSQDFIKFKSLVLFIEFISFTNVASLEIEIANVYISIPAGFTNLVKWWAGCT